MKRRLNQYSAQLEPDELAAGINAAQQNAGRLAEDASQLLAAGRFPTAAALSVLAIEEAGKVSVLRSLALARDQKETIGAWREYRSHTKKNVSWILPQLAADGARRLETDIATAARRLFRQLPEAARQALEDLPDVLRQMEVQTQGMTSWIADLEASLDGDHGVFNRELAEVRDAAQLRLVQTDTALETIRIELLRVHEGGALESLTVQLAAAREITRAVDLLLAQAREIGQVLDWRAVVSTGG